ncbi:hypothetical protein SAMN04488117_101669 [Celeribacter baekdonensis]|uniref:Nickel/cobalt transporter regulator n=1 Tax=Celeribacter baekdonensis TaxID=875171 RepID=A0A1G7GQH3_9RHOB|nr:hypothetical protein [Celeribacter baekdonensis]SDE90364.1 hypothetical protein SAMN04488117_101669 [Celeribacter baekdonensis]
MSNLTKPLLIAVMALTAAPALADKGHNNGKGWGVGHVPPGHAKKMRYGYGDRLPEGYVILRDYDRYHLPDPDGDRYAQYDGQIYKVARDAATVVSAIGIISDLLN